MCKSREICSCEVEMNSMPEVNIEDLREKLKEQVDILARTVTTSEIQSASLKVQGLSVYLSSYDTQQLIYWNRILAASTVVLAIATVVLAYITYLKPP